MCHPLNPPTITSEEIAAYAAQDAHDLMRQDYANWVESQAREAAEEAETEDWEWEEAA